MADTAKRFSIRVIHAIMRANLSAAHKHLLNLICYHHNDKRGYAWPSVERLALMSGNVDPRTIQRQLRDLQKRGLVDIKPMPGLRTNAYQLQEQAIADICISGITWPKNVLGHPAFACATPALECSNPDTGVTLTEEEDLKKNGGGGTDSSPPAFFATPEIQNSQTAVNSETADAPATSAECSVFANLVDQINTQRANNGKKPFVLADLAQLRAEAAKAGISPEEAAKWILERTGRNFFKADYYCIPTTAPTAAPVAPTAPVVPPAKPLSPEELAAQAATVQECREKARKLVEEMRSSKSKNAGTQTAHAALINTANLAGPKWAVEIVQGFAAGMPVKHYALETACAVLKISAKALRFECRPPQRG